MTLDWQTAIVLVVVAACACYVARLVWQSLARRRAGCGACGTCPVGAERNEPQVFGLTQPLPKQNAGGR